MRSSPPPQARVLGLERIDGLRPARPLQSLQRASLALLAPLRQIDEYSPSRRKSAPTSPGANTLSLPQDPQLVLGREPPTLRPLNQLRIRTDPRGTPASRSVALAYGSLHSTAGGASFSNSNIVYSDLALSS